MADYYAADPARESEPDVRPSCSVANTAERTEWCFQAHVVRHLIGNPFRPYPAPPFWPAFVVALADALYNGQSCHDPLHDALLEAGHPELAEHFRDKEHPKGCWALDLILGKK